MIKQNYGKYSIPKRLNELIDIQKRVNDLGIEKYGDMLGYYFSLEGIDTRYLNTPLDVIAFARPGVDGIHFGFLTEFGQVADLHNAYIVRVTPMDFENPVQIVARNMNDFLCLLCYYPSAMDLLHINSTTANIEQFLSKYPLIPKETILNNEEYRVQQVLWDALQLEPINNLEKYFYTIQQDRLQETVLPTLDSIGVTNKLSTSNEVSHNLFHFEHVDQLTISQVVTFFNHATYEAKLAFLRDAQSKGLLFENVDVKHFLKEQLRSMQLLDEAERISFP